MAEDKKVSSRVDKIAEQAKAAGKMLHSLANPTIDPQILRDMQENQAAFHAANRLAAANTVEEFCKRLAERIKAFEAQLGETEEIGFRLVSFGQNIVVHVREIYYHNPSMIIFTGKTDAGHAAELVQHLTQISFLLMAVKKLEPEKPRPKIGFNQI